MAKKTSNRLNIDSGRFLNFAPSSGSMTSQSKYSPATILSGVTCCVDCGSQAVRGSNDQLLLVRLHCQRGKTQTLPCVRPTRSHEDSNSVSNTRTRVAMIIMRPPRLLNGSPVRWQCSTACDAVAKRCQSRNLPVAS